MNLSESLLYRDIAQLNDLASIYVCVCNRNSKLELVQSLYYHMLDQEKYKLLLDGLERDIFYYCTYVFFQPKRIFTEIELKAKGKALAKKLNTDISPQEWLSYLLKRGWLFPRPANFQVQFEIPADLLSFLRKQWIGYWLNLYSIDFEKHEISVEHKDEETALIKDLFLFLSELQAKPLPLTVSGYIYKKNQRQLLQKFLIKEDLINEREYRFGYGRRFPAYPNRLALIYDFCFEKGWILEQDALLSISNQGEKFLEEDTPSQFSSLLQELIHFWLKVYGQPIPNLQFLFVFIKEILNRRLVLISDLFKLLFLWLEAYYFDDVERVFETRIILMLSHLGVVQVCQDNKYITLKNSF